MSLSPRPFAALSSAVAFAALLVGAAPGGAGAQTSPGWRYTVNVITDSGDVAHRGSIAIRYQVTSSNVRTEMVQVSGSSMPAMPSGMSLDGMYTITRLADSTMTNVMPSGHVASIMAVPTLGAFGGGATAIATHTSRQDVEDLGAGERIMGHATHRYRVSTEGTREVTRNGQTCSRSTDAVTDLWIAPDVDIAPAMRLMLGQFGGQAQVDTMIQLSSTGVARPLPKGTPLRSISRTTRTDSTGKPHTVTTTLEYSELASGPIADSVFTVPAGYRVMDMRTLMATLPAGMMDSVRQAAASAPSPLCR